MIAEESEAKERAGITNPATIANSFFTCFILSGFVDLTLWGYELFPGEWWSIYFLNYVCKLTATETLLVQQCCSTVDLDG